MDEKPTESELSNVAKEVGSEFTSLLRGLDIESNKIGSWKVECLGKPYDICFAGLVYWRNGNCKKPITWRTLLDVLSGQTDLKEYAREKTEELSQRDRGKEGKSSASKPEVRSTVDGTGAKKPLPKDVCFAIMTANQNEWNSVQHFLGVQDCEVSEKIRDWTFEKDDLLKDSELTMDPGDGYTFFSVGRKKGLIFHCTNMGSYSRGGSHYETFMLLRDAQKYGWPLKVIFIVGCCGGADKHQKDQKGAVFVADSFYQYAGKIEGDRRIQVKIGPHNVEIDWIRDITKANTKVVIYQVPFFSGDFVIKDKDFSRELQDILKGHQKVGFEMEGIGAITAVDLYKKILPTPLRPDVVLVKGVSDNAGDDKNEDAPIRFFSQPPEENVDEDTRQQMCTVMSLAAVLRAIVISSTL